ncbi:MAG: hypothetical protein LBS51_02885 [Oscillospiraceae bacterium]|jgi:phenylpyruvate tautomerase PptA (4-oxalocrotonate tautomerase family)|nr:hypothetical protein [Oscillospiraceae bacterium]
MPYFRVSVSQKLTEEKADELVEGLGIALEAVPDKKRFMLICDLEDGKRVYMGGKKQGNFAFADIHYCGSYTHQVKCKLTEEVFGVFSRVLGITPECASLTITEHHNWGGFGNFHDDFYSDGTGQ